MNNLYLGTGADFTGVPTKLLNVNGSLRISVYNPATFFGIHVSSTPVNLIYSDVVVATGEVCIYLKGPYSFSIFQFLRGKKVFRESISLCMMLSSHSCS